MKKNNCLPSEINTLTNGFEKIFLPNNKNELIKKNSIKKQEEINKVETEEEVGREEERNYLTYESINLDEYNIVNEEVRGKVVGLIGSKGGVGTTFIASHLAVLCLKKEYNSKVVLVDLNLGNGDIRTVFIQTEPVKDLGDLSSILDELSDISVENVVEDTNNEISAIFSPNDFKKVEKFREDDIQQIVDILRSSYEYIFLDLPNNLNLNSTKAGINSSDELIIVTLPQFLSIRRCDCLLKEITSFKKGANIHLVVNRYDSFSAIPLRHIEQFLEIPISQVISEDLTLGMMFDQKGTLLCDRKDLSVISSINKLVYIISDSKNLKVKED
ncbi:MAG: AAA family ATPase [Actinomycetota bacterium]